MNDKGTRAVHTAAFVERITDNHNAKVNRLERRITHLENTLMEVYAAIENLNVCLIENVYQE